MILDSGQPRRGRLRVEGPAAAEHQLLVPPRHGDQARVDAAPERRVLVHAVPLRAVVLGGPHVAQAAARALAAAHVQRHPPGPHRGDGGAEAGAAAPLRRPRDRGADLLPPRLLVRRDLMCIYIYIYI